MRRVEVEWGNVADVGPTFVNQVIATLGVPAGEASVPDSINLIFGHAAAPLFTGTPEQIHAKVDALQSVLVRPVARLVMSRERAEELLQVLAQTVSQYDAAVQSGRRARA